MQTAFPYAAPGPTDQLYARAQSGADRFRSLLVGKARLDDDVFAAPSALDLRASTRRILTEGGDARIALDASGINAYGCPPQPDPELVALGSSTASVVSGPGFDAALALHVRLLREPQRHPFEVERVRQRIGALSGAIHVEGTELVLAASGTDILLIARQLTEGRAATPVIALMAEPAETGSGVPAALAGQHFAADTCSGQAVNKGTTAIVGTSHAAACVSLRRKDGTLRPIDEVDAEFTNLADQVMRGGGRCLLVLTDVSKTGLVAPSPACARRLSQRYPRAIEVLVDACQFRLSPSSVAAYLQDDFMVALTGSKFVTGPTFCGALLLPPAVARRARRVPLRALRPYSMRTHWPTSWSAANELPESTNTGLLLRWEAALTELTAFAALPSQFAETFLARWGAAVASRIADDSGLESLEVVGLHGYRAGTRWDCLQSIFPFLVVDPRQRKSRLHVNRGATLRLHHQLQGLGGNASRDRALLESGNSQRFQLGQPVACGERGGIPVSALRVCASVRTIVAASRSPDGIERAIDSAMRAFDRVAVLSAELATGDS